MKSSQVLTLFPKQLRCLLHSLHKTINPGGFSWMQLLQQNVIMFVKIIVLPCYFLGILGNGRSINIACGKIRFWMVG